tara:strand:+ start:3368 stop:4852 length:1485 start_codon:yes stop_codon:yes gene_type:complete
MALFDETTAKDPFGFLGTKPEPSKIQQLSGYEVGSDANTKRNANSNFNIPTDNTITRDSVNNTNNKGILEKKISERENTIHKPFVNENLTDSSSNLGKTILDRKNNPYRSSDAINDREKFDIEKKHTKSKYTGIKPPTVDSGKLEQDVLDFKEKYNTALQNLDVNRETSMLNNIKEKGVLSALSGGETSKISNLASKPPDGKKLSDSELLKLEQERRYYDELGKKYEDKYSDDKNYLAKKKLPNYSSVDQKTRTDQYNRQGVVDNNITSEYSLSEDDLIPLYFHDLVNKKFIPFRAFLTDVSESSDANWSEVRYLGRADAVQIYSGFTRTLSVGFNVQAFSIEELHPMWQRINHLVGLTKPATYSGDISGTASKLNSFIIPPFVKFRLGDIYRNQPVIITTVGTTIPTEASWELISNDRGESRDYEYLNGTIKRKNVKSAQYPTMVTINVGMTMLEKRAPQTIARHFGDSNVERDNGLDDVSIENGDFNHQLIH